MPYSIVGCNKRSLVGWAEGSEAQHGAPESNDSLLGFLRQPNLHRLPWVLWLSLQEECATEDTVHTERNSCRAGETAGMAPMPCSGASPLPPPPFRGFRGFRGSYRPWFPCFPWRLSRRPGREAAATAAPVRCRRPWPGRRSVAASPRPAGDWPFPPRCSQSAGRSRRRSASDPAGTLGMK